MSDTGSTFSRGVLIAAAHFAATWDREHEERIVGSRRMTSQAGITKNSAEAVLVTPLRVDNTWLGGAIMGIIARPIPCLSPRQIANFWKHVAKRAPNECWIWTGSCRDGYGEFYIDRRAFRAPRVSWAIHHGDPGIENVVCHTCDNRPCVNPAHMFLGTFSDNHADMVNKERNARGTAVGGAKLNPASVAHIRQAYASGTETQSSLARMYLVSRRTIAFVVSGKHWAHLQDAGPLTPPTLPGTAKLSFQIAQQIRERRAKGEKVVDLAREYGVSRRTLGRIVMGRAWKTNPDQEANL